ncbi:MAG: glutamate racemase [Chitinophagaceae bacterium]
MSRQHPIGIFDSGYGGLTILQEVVKRLPQYDYLYLGDNARAPYGNRSFETVYQYTLQCVQWFLSQQCPLIILACNTASAKALRTIQQRDLPLLDPGKKVLGIIRPTTEVIGSYTRTGSVGILATSGTVTSGSYPLEIAKFFPALKVYQQACPLWVPLIENNQQNTPGATYFFQNCIQQLLQQSPQMDTILLACTHYPLIRQQIRALVPSEIKLLEQGPIIAQSLADYLDRHVEISRQLTTTGARTFYTTDSTLDFDRQAKAFYGEELRSYPLSFSI